MNGWLRLGWLRLGAAALSVPQLVTGAWAVATPSGWYEGFPGFGPALVAAEPPYNGHLATDAGAGFLATGVVLLLAALWGDRRGLRLALAGYLAFAVPHAVYHAGHPSHLLSDTQNTLNTTELAAAVAVALLLLWGTWKGRGHEAAAEDAGLPEGAAPGAPEPYGPAARAGSPSAAGRGHHGVRDRARLQ